MPVTSHPRRAELEAAILDDPDARDAYAVYADWLLEQGEPDGELVAIQLALEASPGDAERRGVLHAITIHGDAYSNETAHAYAELVGDPIATEDATIAVEVTRIIEEDWTKFANAVPVTVTLTNTGRAMTRATIGDALDLVVRLDAGYETGDLV